MTATLTAPPRPGRILPWSRLGDETLAGRAASGQDGAFAALYERYYGPLLGYTRSILLDDEDARDATQNALENALRALPRRDASLPLRPWLYKIAHNEAINIMRRRRPQDELTDGFEPTVPGPEVDAEQRGRLAQLVDDLRTLPERQRGALVMRELSGLSYDEIGDALGVTNEAARRAVFDARSALHAAVDGRATECVSVRHCISDGDRRRLRARSIRAHLRSCNDCASFQRSIGARTADLHLLAPWASGAAIIGALGLGAGGAGGGALLAGGGTSAAAGGGIGWAGLPMAVKGIAVAAAVATTGTAAVEIKSVATPDRRAASAQVAEPRNPRADALAMRAATLAAAAAARARRDSTVASAGSSSLRMSTGSGRSSSTGSTAAGGSGARSSTPLLAPPATVAPKPAPAPAASKPQTSSSQSATKTPVSTPTEQAVARLDPLLDAVRQAFADAQAIAAGGSQASLALATGMLDRTLGPLRTSINRVLAPFGMSLPVFTASAPTTSQPTTSNVLAPVQQVLSGVQNLLARLLGGG